MEEIELHEKARCMKIMLKAGADLSLVFSAGVSLFMDAVQTGSFVNKIIQSQL
jgi:hypothetical protein